MESFDVVVVGAGVSGTSAAYALYKRGAEVLLLEAGDEVGGSMRSVVTPDGYTLDLGPNTLGTKDARLWSEFADLGISRQLIAAERVGRKRYFLKDGTPLAIPSSPVAMVQTPLISTAAKLRMLREPFAPAGSGADESVKAFFDRRIGPDAMARLVDPFVSGVYSGDPSQMSIKATFPALWEAERRGGSMIRGMLKGGKKQDAGPKGPKMKSLTFNFEGGIATWPRAIARALGDRRVWRGARVTDLFNEGGMWRLVVERDGRAETVETRAVVVATPAYAAADLVADLDLAASSALRAIPYSSMAVVHLGYSREQVAHPLDGFGVLAPSCEQKPFLGILWTSSLFPAFAPRGKALTTTLMGGSIRPIRPEQSQEELVATAIRENEAVLGARGKPELVHFTRWHNAVAQYNFGHDERIAAIERLEVARPGLYFAGSYRGGVGVPKCWRNAVELADRVFVDLTGSREPVQA
jgi:oxygen-dependent protoporphyrinogen oxidase